MDVLVVDDEAIGRRMMENTLREGGYTAVVASNGHEALEIIREQQCQLVLTDWQMPGMSGIDLCRTVRESDFPFYVYLILVTARNRPIDTITGLHIGADDYVAKPFNPGELLMRVNAGRRILGIESRAMTTFALAKLAESRDPETGAHLERVRTYCRVLAVELRKQPRFSKEIGDEFIHHIYETSPLHDIGKVAIPDAILLKPGGLSVDEFEQMKSHTLRGAETLAAAMHRFPNATFLRMAHDIALYHHERYDGSGYPYGLVGDQIPLCARILALADVYDALTSKRVYKEAGTHEFAKQKILEERGKHFDPAIVDAFVDAEQRFIAVHARFK